MVRVTIEQDGNVTTHVGEFFFGGVVTHRSEDVSGMKVMVYGRRNQHNFPQDIGNMTVNILTKTTENQIDANEMLLEFYYFLDKKIKERMKENADARLATLFRFLKRRLADEND